MLLKKEDKLYLIIFLLNLTITILIIYYSNKKLDELGKKKSQYDNANDENNENDNSMNSSFIKEGILVEEQNNYIFNSLYSNNSNNSFDSNSSTKESSIEEILHDIPVYVIWLGVLSILIILIFLCSFGVDEKKCCECCYDCLEEGDYEEESGCLAACLCCTCFPCKRRKCKRGCCDGCDGCQGSSCNCSGGDAEGMGYLIMIILFLSIFILIYFCVKYSGKTEYRIFTLLFLILIDLAYFSLGITYCVKDEMDTFSSVVIFLGIVGLLCNIFAFAFKCCNLKRFIFKENVGASFQNDQNQNMLNNNNYNQMNSKDGFSYPEGNVENKTNIYNNY